MSAHWDRLDATTHKSRRAKTNLRKRHKRWMNRQMRQAARANPEGASKRKQCKDSTHT